MKRFYGKKEREAFERSWRGRYAKYAKRHSLLLIGVPFMGSVVAASFLLTGFTRLRYERYDRHVTGFTDKDMDSVKHQRRRVDMREEYYRLQKMGTENWDQVRVPRLEGESENVW